MPCNRAVFGAFILAVLIGLQSAYFKLYEFYRNNDNAQNTTASVFLKQHEVAVNVVVEFLFDILFFLCGLLGFELTPAARRLIFRKSSSAVKADSIELQDASSKKRNDPADGEGIRNVSKTSLLNAECPSDTVDRDGGTLVPPAYSPSEFFPPPPASHLYETPKVPRLAPSAPSFNLFTAGGLAS
uniref:VP12 n=1 Tax=Eyach virus TaxID=62352 RepID=A0A8G0QED4_9REOV|nr:VP12 [Eyach virus]